MQYTVNSELEAKGNHKSHVSRVITVSWAAEI